MVLQVAMLQKFVVAMRRVANQDSVWQQIPTRLFAQAAPFARMVTVVAPRSLPYLYWSFSSTILTCVEAFSAILQRCAVAIPPAVILVIVFQLILKIGCALGAPCAQMERVVAKRNNPMMTCVEASDAILRRFAAVIRQVAILVSVFHLILKIGFALGVPSAQMERVAVKRNR